MARSAGQIGSRISGFAVWSLILGAAGDLVLIVPELQITVAVRTAFALLSLLAAALASIAISQIKTRPGRGLWIASIGILLGAIGIFDYIFSI